MLVKLAGKIYGLLYTHVGMDVMCGRLRRIYACTEESACERCRDIYTAVIAKMIAVLIAAVLLTLAMLIFSLISPDKVTLKRQGYGGDSTEKKLEVVIDGEKSEFEVEVLPLEYDESELKDVFDAAFEFIDESYLGENSSAEEVSGKLNLVDSIDELGVSVSWLSEDYEVVSSDGTVRNEDESLDTLVRLTAIVSYGDDSAERDYQIRVIGRTVSDKERVLRLIESDINDVQKANSGIAEVELPEKIRGYTVKDADHTSPFLAAAVLGLAAAAALWTREGSRLRRLDRKRDEELMFSYPLLVDRITMYLGAGLTVRGAFARIAEGTSSDSGEALKRELRYTLNEISSGVPESEAYYNMGHRIKLPLYIKLMSLLSQNIKKGTRDLLAVMAGEEEAAVTARKEMARKKGEEAGTKLLFPMIILLSVVMLIVICPAAAGF